MLAVLFGATSCKKEGCTDQLATNFDADANENDGSCIYLEKEEVEEDRKPHVNIISPSQSADPQNISIEVEAADDVDLKSYTLVLKRGGIGLTVFESEGNLSGTSATIGESVVIDPELVKQEDVTYYGSYTLAVTVLDSEDQSTTASSTFDAEDNVNPVIDLITVPETIGEGEMLRTEVNSSDLSGIRTVAIRLYTFQAGDLDEEFDEAIYNYSDDDTERTTVNNLFGYENPLTSGQQYMAEVTVTDQSGLSSTARSNLGLVE
ncbi:MAG: hypothetical protein Salg2KO_21210 [Salibacteraceae bacterium]